MFFFFWVHVVGQKKISAGIIECIFSLYYNGLPGEKISYCSVNFYMLMAFWTWAHDYNIIIEIIKFAYFQKKKKKRRKDLLDQV